MTATRSKQIVPETPLVTAWGSRLNPVDDALFIQGYRCFVKEGSLLVRKPNGTTYLLNPYQDSCSCPARGNCKHKRQIVSLVFLSLSELAHRGKFDHYDELANFWFNWCCHVGRSK